MPDVNHIRAPGPGRHVWRNLSTALLRLIGWRVEGELPDVPKLIVIVYPHTSNWDLLIGMLSAYALGLLGNWPYGYMVKDSAVRWPVVGRWLRRQGALAIDRRKSNSLVDQMAQIFAERERLMLAITPEGTRRRTGYWKSGFYYIALKAGVPILLAYLDYRRRVGGLGPLLWPSGDAEADLERMRQFYQGVHGLYPHLAGEIRFRPQITPGE